ncbi:preprotein translocase subunit SecG [Caenimonas sedimenti]|uniref:Protein-export membrane protein SecG n=1 Tax=Caenimonas sedimenti TaxID=2596921 RepID=A0A562ZJY7_9BURK|nr:preprotein translocase subunit SecG [Caenimonas sedimenti]TWO68628.1 preprotein translocase subunit SecG [Caenimonas sedimenti]
MNVVLTLVLAVQMLTALGMIGLILLQHGKGADMGAAFGSGSSGSLFGASGSANFLSRTTAVLAAVFFVCTLLLAYFGNLRPAGTGGSSVLERAGVSAPAASAPAPATPASGAAQIPAGAISVPMTPAVPAPAATPASGAAQIPTK